MFLRIAVGLIALVLALAAGITLYVQAEADYRLETIADQGVARALVLYHPSRDARFSEDLSSAFAQGLIMEGFAVDRATISRDSPARPEGYDLVAIVANTFYQRPDRPTAAYLKRADLSGLAVASLIGGSGSTESAARLLKESLEASGGEVIAVRQYWIHRPNDEARTDRPNRQVAIEMARAFGVESAKSVASSRGGAE